ncbi:unnamed protein product [Paramecium sonneborni]|uniref:Uncharacterized protein n=1 Tax=Paramecium sonneborni TaxID=65129 RepID=A0A8S1RNY7_9CILI|nr:unnamed protein product [Paramecium sonneborni]
MQINKGLMLKEIQLICHHLNKLYNYLTQMNWQYLYQELLVWNQNNKQELKKQLDNGKIFGQLPLCIRIEQLFKTDSQSQISIEQK